jgi:hypothetical protein
MWIYCFLSSYWKFTDIFPWLSVITYSLLYKNEITLTIPSSIFKIFKIKLSISLAIFLLVYTPLNPFAHLKYASYLEIHGVKLSHLKWPIDHSLCAKGTAGVAIAGLLGAVRAQGRPMIDFPKQKIVVAGAGRFGILQLVIKVEYESFVINDLIVLIYWLWCY